MCIRDRILLKQFVSAIPLKPLNKISWNFVVMNDIMCWCAYPQEILIPFFSRSYALFEFRNLTKMKDATEIVFQRNSSEAAQQNFVKLCSYEGLNVQMCISIGNSYSFFFFWEECSFLNLEIWPKLKILLKQFVSATETAQQNLVKLCCYEGINV